MIGAQIVVDAVAINLNVFGDLVDVAEEIIEERPGALLYK